MWNGRPWASFLKTFDDGNDLGCLFFFFFFLADQRSATREAQLPQPPQRRIIIIIAETVGLLRHPSET